MVVQKHMTLCNRLEGGIRRRHQKGACQLPFDLFIISSSQCPGSLLECGTCDLRVRQISSENVFATEKWRGGEVRVTAVGFMTIQFWFLYLSKRSEKQEKNKGFWYFVEDFCFCGSSRILVCNFFLLFF